MQISLLLYHILTCAFGPFLNVFPSANQRSTAHGEIFFFSFPLISVLTRSVGYGKAKLCPLLSYRRPWGNGLPNTAVSLQDEHRAAELLSATLLLPKLSSAEVHTGNSVVDAYSHQTEACCCFWDNWSSGWIIFNALITVPFMGPSPWSMKQPECKKQGSFP